MAAGRASPIYEIRTYTLRPGTRDEFERLLGEALIDRVKISPLAKIVEVASFSPVT